MRVGCRWMLLCVMMCAIVGTHAMPTEDAPKSSMLDSPPLTVADWKRVLPYNVSTVFAEYLARPESVYSWVEHEEFREKGIGFTSYVLNVTSLTWLDPTQVSRSLWWNWVVIFVPDNPEPRFADNALLYITGNSNEDTRPPSIITDPFDWLPQTLLCTLGRNTVVTVFQIPNADVYFYEEKPTPQARGEDALIAWTWHHFLNDPSNPEWLARFPMVKASIAAMNASTEFLATYTEGRQQNVENWIVAGASKRGWTTWIVGAMDPRVIAIIPLVFDELNFVSNIHHHYRSYGGWSFALKDYVALNLTGSFDDPLLQVMMEMVDPFSYFNNSRLGSIPKFIVSAGGDEFLMNDNVRWFWNQMPGEKHFRSFPNVEHSMAGDILGVVDTVLAFAMEVQLNQTRPVYDWSIDPVSGMITVVCDAPFPDGVELWYSPTIDGNVRRDWRLATCPDGCPNPHKYTLHNVTWFNDNTHLTNSTQGNQQVFQALVPPPVEGWVAWIVSLSWNDGEKGEFHVSSAPSILPLAYPYPDCVGEGCIAGMV